MKRQHSTTEKEDEEDTDSNSWGIGFSKHREIGYSVGYGRRGVLGVGLIYTLDEVKISIKRL